MRTTAPVTSGAPDGWLRGVARRILPRAALRTADRLRRRGVGLGVVVVVTESNAVFLDSLLGQMDDQKRRADSVLLAPVGGAAAASAPVRAAVARSWRVRCLPASTDRGVAVSRGARAAAEARLMVLDAGDQLASTAFTALWQAMDRADADVAGAAREELGGVVLAQLMFRTPLWGRSRACLPDAPYGEWVAAVGLVLGAAKAVSTAVAATSPERRRSGAAFGTLPVLAPSAVPWADHVRWLLTALADEPARDPVLLRLLDLELPRYLDDAERCSSASWEALRELTVELLHLAPEEVVQEIRVESKVRLQLAAGGRRDELEQFNADRWLDGGQFAARVDRGTVVALLPVDPALVPPATLRLGASETSLVTELRRIWWDEDGVAVEVLAAVDKVSSDAGDRSVSMAWVNDAGTRLALDLEPAPDPEANLVVRDRFADHTDDVVRGRVRLADLLGASPSRWHLQVEVRVAGLLRRGTVERVDARGSVGGFPPRRVGGKTIGCRLRPGGGLALVTDEGPDADPTPEERGSQTSGWGVSDLVVEGTDLVLRGRLASPDVARASFVVRGPHTTGEVIAPVTEGAFETRVPLLHDPWQLGDRPLPPGTYRVFVRSDGAAELPLPTAPALTARTPLALTSDTWRVRVRRALDGGTLVVLAAPLADDEVGPAAQQRLQSRYATTDRPTDPRVVYLQSYTGQVTTDSPVAIHHALRSLRPDLSLRWGVADSSTAVPSGGCGVLIRSRDWYDVLAGSGWVVTNIDMERWFVPRPDQRLLQSFHGYPSKIMGISAWEAKNLTRRRIERQLRRTSGTWDLLLAPNETMAEHYRREYEYTGAILAAGYPRDDALRAPTAEHVRSRTRSRLGIPGHARVVLYAPTWRDDVATNFRAAPAVDQLDVDRAARALGPDYVILLRGHRFHRPRSDASTSARLRDVTEYPEINDLILAADAAVLDYSSLRFDFALTGRPMVFLVPDLDRYEARTRGFLFDFASSAPGPLMTTTGEVIEALRDLDRLEREHRDRIARFNASFNDRQDGSAAERTVQAFFGPGPA